MSMILQNSNSRAGSILCRESTKENTRAQGSGTFFGDPGGIIYDASAPLTRSELLRERLVFEPRGFELSARVYQVKTPVIRLRLLLGDLTSISLEHLFDDLFRLRDNFKALGMILKDGEAYLSDLGDVQ
ncbi:MAG TPA: hypothetical protein PJ984_02620 [Candidatus Saccharibacteria bacterium]|nr:hypothetical protein [Candidatus Saccharibacteria bacterium]